MPERLRANLDHEGTKQVVTVLSGKPGAKTGTCEVRTHHGFKQMVPARALSQLDEDDPKGILRFETPND